MIKLKDFLIEQNVCIEPVIENLLELSSDNDLMKSLDSKGICINSLRLALEKYLDLCKEKVIAIYKQNELADLLETMKILSAIVYNLHSIIEKRKTP